MRDGGSKNEHGSRRMYSQVPSFERTPQGTGEEDGWRGEGEGRKKEEEPWIWFQQVPLQATELGTNDVVVVAVAAAGSFSFLACFAVLQAPHAAPGGWLAGLAGCPRRCVRGFGPAQPRADLGITSGARQGVKGDPRGPFTSASCCLTSRPGSSTMGASELAPIALLGEGPPCFDASRADSSSRISGWHDDGMNFFYVLWRGLGEDVYGILRGWAEKTLCLEIDVSVVWSR